MDPALAALIGVFIASIIGPALLAHLVAVQRRKDKKDEYARQDAIAARLEASDIATNTKLDIIHTLVNSNLTIAIQAELEATKISLTSLKEVIELKKAAGLEPTPEALGQVEATAIRIAKLTSALTERAIQDSIVRSQTAVSQAKIEVAVAKTEVAKAQTQVAQAQTQATEALKVATEIQTEATHEQTEATKEQTQKLK